MATVPGPITWDALRLLLTAARIVQRRQNEAFAFLSLTHSAVIALEAVELGPMGQKQLAAKVGIRNQSMGRMITRFEARGLVTRTRNPNDQRQFLVRNSAAGTEALNSAVEAELMALFKAMDGWGTLRDLLLCFVKSS